MYTVNMSNAFFLLSLLLIFFQFFFFFFLISFIFLMFDEKTHWRHVRLIRTIILSVV